MVKPQPIVGHLVNTPQGLVGEWGSGYTYVLAGDGLYVNSHNNLLRATVKVAVFQVRGLLPRTPSPWLSLQHGRVPADVWNEAVDDMRVHLPRETYVAVRVVDGRYALDTRYDLQVRERASVSYVPGPDTLVHLHSHARMGAFFSPIDDQDEQGLALYGVVGNVHETTPDHHLRVGVYGHFQDVAWPEVFE
jgi:PRTRC genetic system protein A